MGIFVPSHQIDELTQIPNYSAMSSLLPVWFREGVEKTRSALTERERGGVLVIFCDGDGLKPINDSYGHDRGNDFIRALIDRVKNYVPTICGCAITETVDECQNHFVARDGGDELIVIIRNVMTEDAARVHVETLEEFLNKLAFKIEADSEQFIFKVKISLGGAWSNGQLANGEPDTRRLDNPFKLKEDADIAMRHAKKHRIYGRRFAYFELSMWEKVVEFERLSLLYWRAVRYGDYTIAFMPIVEATSYQADKPQLFALEALVRLSSPESLDSGLVLSPDKMEAFGVTTDLLLSFIPRVLDQLLSWQKQCGNDLPLVFVNVTPQLLIDEQVYHEVLTLLRSPQYADVKHHLVFEFTEDNPLPPTELVREGFAQLRQHVKVALDDYGNGHSNPITLARFDWDVVKLDKAMLLEFDDDYARCLLAANVGAITHVRPTAMVLIEGIEDERRHQIVQTMVHTSGLPSNVLGQGYHYGRAMPEADLFARGLLTARRSAS